MKEVIVFYNFLMLVLPMTQGMKVVIVYSTLEPVMPNTFTLILTGLTGNILPCKYCGHAEYLHTNIDRFDRHLLAM